MDISDDSGRMSKGEEGSSNCSSFVNMSQAKSKADPLRSSGSRRGAKKRFVRLGRARKRIERLGGSTFEWRRQQQQRNSAGVWIFECKKTGGVQPPTVKQ
jgi:hypothetical protein